MELLLSALGANASSEETQTGPGVRMGNSLPDAPELSAYHEARRVAAQPQPANPLLDWVKGLPSPQHSANSQIAFTKPA